MLGVMNLHQIHDFEKGKFMYRLTNHKLPNNFDNLWCPIAPRANYNLRSNDNGSIKESFARTNYGYRRIQSSGAKLWNSIPTTIKHCESLNIFVEKYKKYILTDQEEGEQSTAS